MEQDVSRFVAAQEADGAYDRALRELRAGTKRSHWIWYVFPQVAGLGSSPTAQLYGLGGLAEARAYLAHPVLGPRLRECASVLVGLGGHDPVAVLGGIDAVKLRSSMTLFARAATGDDSALFRAVLAQYFDGAEDPATLARI